MDIVLALGLGVVLCKIAYLDYKYYYIADQDIVIGILLSLGLKYRQGCLLDSCLGLALGGLCAGIVYLGARAKYKFTAFGGGDVTLFLFLGSLVGGEAFPSWAVFFSFSFLVTLIPLHITKNLSWRKAFPLAPFLILSTLLWFIFDHSPWRIRL